MKWVQFVGALLLLLCAALSRCGQVNSSPISIKSSSNSDCKRLLWFTAISGKVHHKRYLRAAMSSKMDNAPSLIPHLLYTGPKDDELIRWYQSNNGTVHFHNLTFYKDLAAAVKRGRYPPAWLTMHGAFLRLDLPVVLQNLTVDDPDVETSYILYTDVDVMFLKDINTCNTKKPAILAVGPEFVKGEIANTGVMLMNLKAFAAERQALIDYGNSQSWAGAFDQDAILDFFKGRLQLLPDEFNWKGYWGANRTAMVVHFHGPKPDKCLDCLVLHQAFWKELRDCGCPEQYLRMYRQSPDGGRFFQAMLALYSHYLLRSYNLVGFAPPSPPQRLPDAQRARRGTGGGARFRGVPPVQRQDGRL